MTTITVSVIAGICLLLILLIITLVGKLKSKASEVSSLQEKLKEKNAEVDRIVRERAYKERMEIQRPLLCKYSVGTVVVIPPFDHKKFVVNSVYNDGWGNAQFRLLHVSECGKIESMEYDTQNVSILKVVDPGLPVK